MNVFYYITKQINPVPKPFQCYSVAGGTVERMIEVYELENPHKIFFTLSSFLQSAKACLMLSSLSGNTEVELRRPESSQAHPDRKQKQELDVSRPELSHNR